MVTVTIGEGGKKTKLRSDLIAAMYFEEEFPNEKNMGGHLLSMGQAVSGGKYEDIDFLFLTRVMWAMAKNAADNPDIFPGFKDWLKQTRIMNFHEVTEKVITEAIRGFFPNTEAESSE